MKKKDKERTKIQMCLDTNEWIRERERERVENRKRQKLYEYNNNSNNKYIDRKRSQEKKITKWSMEIFRFHLIKVSIQLTK